MLRLFPKNRSGCIAGQNVVVLSMQLPYGLNWALVSELKTSIKMSYLKRYMYSPNALAQTYVAACPSHSQTHHTWGWRLFCCRMLMGSGRCVPYPLKRTSLGCKVHWYYPSRGFALQVPEYTFWWWQVKKKLFGKGIIVDSLSYLLYAGAQPNQWFTQLSVYSTRWCI